MLYVVKGFSRQIGCWITLTLTAWVSWMVMSSGSDEELGTNGKVIIIMRKHSHGSRDDGAALSSTRRIPALHSSCSFSRADQISIIHYNRLGQERVKSSFPIKAPYQMSTFYRFVAL